MTPDKQHPALTFGEEADRQPRLEALADQAFSLGLRLSEAVPTRDGLGPLVVMARAIATELHELREASE